jgi:hypothetical protein
LVRNLLKYRHSAFCKTTNWQQIKKKKNISLTLSFFLSFSLSLSPTCIMSNRSIIYTESNNRDGIQLTNPIQQQQQQQQQQQPEPPQLVPSMTILPKQKFVLPKEPKTSVSHPIK